MKNTTVSSSGAIVNKTNANKTYNHGYVSTFPKNSRLYGEIIIRESTAITVNVRSSAKSKK